MNKEIDYNKINLILSILGFMGSLVFYYNVLKKNKNAKNETPENKDLIRQIKALRKEVKKMNQNS